MDKVGCGYFGDVGQVSIVYTAWNMYDACSMDG